ncbi:uncharacterized protein LY79DRAFT_573654 [Colletotrichum navitas]|uniref:Secreted protein n=1 Tax=Colletotrichum navitas TaxID=681940 RepID=A0AAD8UWK9_9PEZI|nr:uncharacterized protein LY79DRAFT_573654 [Colletotrichum navitas]KAK1564099.1 hypothetical protein LY79DRAFT_573654 [Colletotrichum navitas]
MTHWYVPVPSTWAAWHLAIARCCLPAPSPSEPNVGYFPCAKLNQTLSPYYSGNCQKIRQFWHYVPELHYI